MPIPEFRADGYLPDGVHQATEPEVVFRFGASTPRRRFLVLRLRRWLELVRAVGALRFLVDGSFVTSKALPGDIDAVVELPADFSQRLAAGEEAALELHDLITERGQGICSPPKIPRIGTPGSSSFPGHEKPMDAEKAWWRWSYDRKCNRVRKGLPGVERPRSLAGKICARNPPARRKD